MQPVMRMMTESMRAFMATENIVKEDMANPG